MPALTITVMVCKEKELRAIVPFALPDYALRINTSSIKSYAVREWHGPVREGFQIPTRIKLSGGDWFDVMQTPEQIDALIAEANEQDLARVRSIVAQLKRELLDDLRKNT